MTYKTAWTMLDRIRQAVSVDPLVWHLSGEVEIDDTCYGGRRKGKRGRGAAGKAAVIGIRQRGGRVYTIMVPAVDAQAVRELVRMYVRRGSRVYTDSLSIYRELQALGYRHATVDHGQRFVARTGAHIQGIESHWAHTKWPMMARYRKISHEYLPKYLAEDDFKRNATQEPDFIKTVLGRLTNSTL
jgi:transposase